MAGIISTEIPDTPVDVSTAWQPLVDQHVLFRRGDNLVSLTEWGSSNTTKPAIAAGSAIEINGAGGEFSTETSITNESGLTSGTVYVLIDGSNGSDAVPYFVNDVPTWNASKNGFYRGADERYTGHQMTWDGASSYSAKATFTNSQDGLNVTKNPDGDITCDDITCDDITCDDITAGGVAELFHIHTDPSGNTGMNANYAVKWTRFSGTLDSSGDWNNVPHNIPSIDVSKITAVIYAVYVSGTTTSYAQPGTVNVGSSYINLSAGSTFGGGQVRGLIVFSHYLG